MSAATRPRSATLLGRVLLAPAIWLERARGRKRLALAALYLVVLSIAGLLIWRAASLNGLPDIGDPFDVRAFDQVAVPEAEDAYAVYHRAIAKLSLPEPPDPTRSWSYEWGKADEAMRAWVEANREAMELWRQGADRPDAMLVAPKNLSFDTRLDALQKMRCFARLGQLEGTRLEGLGDMARAWAQYRAILRSSAHVSRLGCLIQHLIGIAMYAVACHRLVAWAEDPRVDARLLRVAIAELKAVEAMTPPPSEAIRIEYLSLMKFLTRSTLPDQETKLDELDDPESKFLWYHHLPRFREVQFFLRREPERSRRIARLVFANWLAHCDDPPSRRPPYVPGPPALFADDPSALPSARLLPREALVRWAESTMLVRAILPAVDAFHKGADRRRRTQATTLLHLAEQLYLREHGAPPRKLGDLVGPYLDRLPDGYAPDDPAASAPASPAPPARLGP